MSDCKSCPYAERLRGAVNALIREANKRDPDWTPAIRDARTALASDPAQGAGKDQSRSALPHPQGGEVASVGERAIPEAKGGSQSAQSVPLLDRNPCPDASATLMPTGAYATIQRNPQAPSTERLVAMPRNVLNLLMAHPANDGLGEDAELIEICRAIRKAMREPSPSPRAPRGS
jgi:hypothetical protein